MDKNKLLINPYKKEIKLLPNSTLYLSHPLVWRKKTRKHELEFERETKINLFNPFYDYDIEKKDIVRSRIVSSRKLGLTITNLDLKHIRDTDGLLAIIEKDVYSIGTHMEFFYNGRILKKPTYVITKTCAGHPWIRAYADKVFKNWKEAIEYFK